MFGKRERMQAPTEAEEKEQGVNISFLRHGREGVEFSPEDLPAGQPVAEIMELRLILRTDIDSQDMMGSFLVHNVSG